MEGEDNDTNPVTFTNESLSTSVKILDNYNQLNDLKIDGVSVNNFSKDNYSYTTSTNKEKVVIEAVAPDNVKQVSGDGTKKLVCGVNNFKIVVTAFDSSKKTYKLSLNRSCDKNTTLKMITLSSGALQPSFSPDVKEYKVDVSTDIAKMSIGVNKNNTYQKVIGEVKNKELKYGANKFEIIVTSQAGTSSTYTIVVNRQDGRNTNNDLASLVLSDGRLKPEFSKDITEYATKVLYDVKSIKVEGVAESQTSKIEVIGGKSLGVGDNKITIKVTSEKGVAKEYKLIVTRLQEGETLGDNPNIKNIYIEGYDINFDPLKNDYYLKIEDEDKLNLEITMDDATSSFVVVGNENLKDGSVININTTSLDGTTKTYKITIEKDNFNFVLIIAIASILLAVALIIFLLIKGKGKNNGKQVTTNIIKNKEKTKSENDDLIAKVEQQLKSVKQNDVVREDLNEDVSNKKIDVKPLNNSFASLRREERSYEEDPSYQKGYVVEEQPVKQQEKNFDEVDNSKEKAETKVCGVCGHRVLASVKTCPYCKRTW